MKSSWLISVLLLAPALICLVNGAQFTRGFCLQLINNGKSVFAEEYHVANMNGLSYDKKLEKKILEQLSFTNGCPEPSIISHKGFDIYLNINNEESIIDLLSGVGKTTMACIKTKCEESGEEFISIVTDYSDIPAISGAPGSQCSDSKTANSDGLCIRGNHRNGYKRKFLDALGSILKKGYEKTGEIGIGIGQTILDGTTAVGKELSKTVGDSETKVVHKTSVLSEGETSLGDIVKDVVKDITKMAEEQGKSNRKYARKGLWGMAYTSPPFVPYPKYQKKEDNEYLSNERTYWPHNPFLA
ncbi:hypothetical protein GCK72_007065 [Caenorhabditis remanei]|uniref:Uncharacterized protein n=1 Tax=Caenorhabditis remanei TaxID=31234 RepID=A0A6A5HKL7_CAERE|nr:hypothetical protein GCK72_007065 [Caenorhabditis remanei]KAF1767107.1 hypothetical protein GCK72_007065 [Caenorhabditis remanei]